MPYKDPETRRLRQREYSRRFYLKNKATYIARAQRQKDAVRAEWIAFKAKQKCAHCGAQHPAVIDFHHPGTKEHAVQELVSRNNNLTLAIKEATENCIPLCSNCHRILHWNEHRARHRKRKKLKL
jgi:hypothetical protein